MQTLVCKHCFAFLFACLQTLFCKHCFSFLQTMFWILKFFANNVQKALKKQAFLASTFRPPRSLHLFCVCLDFVAFGFHLFCIFYIGFNCSKLFWSRWSQHNFAFFAFFAFFYIFCIFLHFLYFLPKEFTLGCYLRRGWKVVVQISGFVLARSQMHPDCPRNAPKFAQNAQKICQKPWKNNVFWSFLQKMFKKHWNNLVF